MLFPSLMLPLIALGSNDVVPNPDPNASPIVIEKHRVSSSFSMSKSMTCEDITWTVIVDSKDRGRHFTGSINIKIDNEEMILAQAESEIFERVDNIDSVGATCEHFKIHPHPISHLLMTATDKESGEYLLIQVDVNREFEADIRISPAS